MAPRYEHDFPLGRRLRRSVATSAKPRASATNGLMARFDVRSLPRRVLLGADDRAGRLGRRLCGQGYSSSSWWLGLLSRLTLRWSGRVNDKVPSSNVGVRAAQLDRYMP
jgi:hypothetical protein